MMDLAPYHRLIVFVHLMGVFLFLGAHGVSAAVLFRLQSEREPAAVRTLVDLSARSFGAMTIGAAIWFFSGILAGFSGNYWTTGRYWIWASLVVVLVVGGLMTPLGRTYVNRIRAALGMDPDGRPDQPITGDVDAVALDAAIRSGRPMLLAALGIGGVIVLSWLMMFKPF